ARLGSAVLWMPPRPPPSLVARLVKLRDGILAELARAGAMPLPTSLWPLHGDADFAALNAARNRQMAAAQTRAGAALSSRLPRLQVTVPHHRCFLFLQPPLNRERRLLADRQELVARLRAAGIEAGFAPSFGYDIVGMAIAPSGAGYRLRVAIPDLPDEDVDRLVEGAAAYWQA